MICCFKKDASPVRALTSYIVYDGAKTICGYCGSFLISTLLKKKTHTNLLEFHIQNQSPLIFKLSTIDREHLCKKAYHIWSITYTIMQ